MNLRRETMDRIAAEPVVRELAERLVAFEARSLLVSEGDVIAMYRVCEKLRHSLSHLTGPAAFNSLFERALTLAQREAPVFSAVRLTEAGALEGLGNEAAEIVATLVAHLLQLLTTFIGQTLTLTFLQDIWPDLPASESKLRKEDKNDSVQ